MFCRRTSGPYNSAPPGFFSKKFIETATIIKIHGSLLCTLTEELGEATTELSRIELAHLARHTPAFDFPNLMSLKNQIANLMEMVRRIKGTDRLRNATINRAKKKLDGLLLEINGEDPWVNFTIVRATYS